MSATSKSVAILGASNNPERYSNKAQKLLLEYGHNVFPINPAIGEINGVKVFSDIKSLISAGFGGASKNTVDVLTIYLGEKRSEPLIEEIVKLNPLHVILNPGAESDKLEAALVANNIPFEKACTLVLLRTGQF